MKTEKTKLQTFDTYDFKDIIKNIEVSTAYIPGLQRIVTNMILEYSEGTEKLPELFTKFGKTFNKTEEDKIEVNLTEEQANIYTIFSLLQLFKYLANEQGLAKKTKTTATIDELKELATMIQKKEDITEKLKDLQSKMTVAS
jgi:hypothetical protein